jgi:hypothetical protein
MASLEKSRNSLQTGVGVKPLFMLRCDRGIGHADPDFDSCPVAFGTRELCC